jgi:hypothetical protein
MSRVLRASPPERACRRGDTTMACATGFYRLPDGPGLGVAPRESLWRHVVRVD